MEDITTRCVYRVTYQEVLAGALRALAKELGPQRGAAIPAELQGWSADELWLIYKEKLRDLARTPETKQSLKSLVELSLRSYCRTLDRYSYYDDFETWRRAEELRAPDYMGVAVTLLEGREDDIVCDPYPGGPAERAGIVEGDRLMEIAGRPVRGATLLQIKTWLAETQSEPVKIRVRHRDGVEETVTIPKEQVVSKPVRVEQTDGESTITLRNISERSVTDLREVLRSMGQGKAITLDLRGCPGGPVPFAVAVASLFLPADTVIGKLETTQGTETLLSTERAPYRPSRLRLLQDRFTGSAAELIIAALLNHAPLRAASFGERTYGKGVTQRRVKVSDKDADGADVIQAGVLTITDSRMYGPNGEVWDETGLAPSR